MTDKASYYLAKLKADKAKAAAAAPRWVETDGGSTNTLLYCRPPPHPPRRPAVPSTVVSHARTTDTSGGPAAPSSSHGPPPTTPSRTSELGLLRGGFSIGVAASDPATNRVTPAIAAAAISGPVHVPLPSATLVAKGSDSVSRGNAPMAGADRGPAPAFLPGQRVASRFGGGEEYFPGVVEAVNDDGTFVVRYDDGDVEEAVPVERLAPEGSVQVEALLDDGDRRESIAAVSAAWAAADMRAPLVPPAVAALAAARSSSDSRAAHVGERRDYPEPVIDAIPEEESEASAVDEETTPAVGDESVASEPAVVPLQGRAYAGRQVFLPSMAAAVPAVPSSSAAAGRHEPAMQQQPPTHLPPSVPDTSALNSTPPSVTHATIAAATPHTRIVPATRSAASQRRIAAASARSIETSYAGDGFDDVVDDDGSEYSANFERASPRAPEPPLPDRSLRPAVAHSVGGTAPPEIAPAPVAAAARLAFEEPTPVPSATTENRAPAVASVGHSYSRGGRILGDSATMGQSYARGGRMLCDSGFQTAAADLPPPPPPHHQNSWTPAGMHSMHVGAPPFAASAPPPVPMWAPAPPGGYGGWWPAYPPSPYPPYAVPQHPIPAWTAPGYGYGAPPPFPYSPSSPYGPPPPVPPEASRQSTVPLVPPPPPVPIPAHLATHPAVLRALAGYQAVAAASDSEFRQQLHLLRSQLTRTRSAWSGAASELPPGSRAASDVGTPELAPSATQSYYTESLASTRAMFDQRRAARASAAISAIGNGVAAGES